MKPAEARAMRQRQDQARAARGEALEAFLRSGEPTSQVRPELIPDGAEWAEARRAVRKLVRRANRSARGPKRVAILDDLIVAAARLVFVERVRALDPLERAALTPARLVKLSVVSPEDVRSCMARWQGQGGVVLPGEETG